MIDDLPRNNISDSRKITSICQCDE